MRSVETRIDKLESCFGADDKERYLRSLSDEELEAQIAELTKQLAAVLAQRGVDASQMTTTEVIARVEALEAADIGHKVQLKSIRYSR